MRAVIFIAKLTLTVIVVPVMSLSIFAAFAIPDMLDAIWGES